MKQQSLWRLDLTRAHRDTVWRDLPKQSRADLVAQLVRLLGQSPSAPRQQVHREKQEEEE